MSETGFDTDGFSTEPVSGLELIKDWAAFAGVGVYLGATYGYLRLTRRVAPPVPLAKLAGTVVLSTLAGVLGSRRGPVEITGSDGGYAYLARGPLRTTDLEGESRLVLLEDGKPLGPRRAPLDEIRTLGCGRYAHWGWAYGRTKGRIPQPFTQVVFSASDNTDPRSNGRSYTYELV